MVSIFHTGRFADHGNQWDECLRQVCELKFIRSIRHLDKVGRKKRFKQSTVSKLKLAYLDSLEIQLALKSSKKHFAFALIRLLEEGVIFMQKVLDGKVALLVDLEQEK